MHSRFEHNGLVWIDLESPTREEVQGIVSEFNIKPLVAEELLLPSTKPRAEFYGEYVYCVLHFPALRHSHKTREQEIDFIIGERFVITTRYDTVDPLHKFSKIFEVNSVLDKSNIGDHAGYLFFYMVKRLYKAVEHEVDFVHHDLAIIEDHVFNGHEVQMVNTISRSARDLLNLRQTIEPHRDVLKDLESNIGHFFSDEFIPYLRALSNEYYRVHNHIMRNTDSLHELRETNNSLLTTKQNETMRVLTIMALLTFPLALFVAMVDVDTVDNPVLEFEHGFWLLIGSVVFLATAMLTFFKFKKWL